MATTRPAPLRLAELVPDLPEVELLNGKMVQLVPLSARGYELFLELQREIFDAELGKGSDRGEGFIRKVDQVLALVMPSATPDDLASFGVRAELKLSVIMAAAGAVDQVLQVISEETNTQGNG